MRTSPPRSWAARTCTRACRAWRTTSPRTIGTRWRSRGASWPTCRRVKHAPWDVAAEPREPRYDPAELYGIVPAGSAQAVRRARGDRAHRRRQRVRRVQGQLRHDAGDRLCAHHGLPGRHRRQQRHSVQRKQPEGRALCRAVLRAQNPAGVPAKHHRLHGRSGVREPRSGARRRQDGDGRRERAGAQVHGDHRQQFWRGQLRHVRPRVSARASCGCGPTRASA